MYIIPMFFVHPTLQYNNCIKVMVGECTTVAYHFNILAYMYSFFNNRVTYQVNLFESMHPAAGLDIVDV